MKIIRTLTLCLLTLNLSTPSHALVAEILEEFQEASLNAFKKLQLLIEAAIVEYEEKLQDDEPEFSEQIAEELDEQLEDLRVELIEQFERLNSSWLFSDEFKLKLIGQMEAILELLDAKLEELKLKIEPDSLEA